MEVTGWDDGGAAWLLSSQNQKAKPGLTHKVTAVVTRQPEYHRQQSSAGKRVRKHELSGMGEDATGQRFTF